MNNVDKILCTQCFFMYIQVDGRIEEVILRLQLCTEVRTDIPFISSGEESNRDSDDDFQDIFVNKVEEISTKWDKDPAKQPFVSDLKELVGIVQEVSKINNPKAQSNGTPCNCNTERA